ncbi:MAG TPA: ATP-binding protein [Polyangiaceae bacterium]|nr:ATP-binding protein [Polyangiaceae bacterium]
MSGSPSGKQPPDEELESLRRRVLALEEEAGALRELVDNLGVGVFTMEDPGGVAIVSRANPAFARIMGFPSAEAAIGQSAFEHYSDPKERAETQAHFMSDPAFRASGVCRFEAIRLRKDTREPVPTLIQIKATFDEQGRLARFYGVIEDTRDRKRAEKAFAASEARFAAVFEESAVGMAMTDIAGAVVRTNRALQSFVGRTEHELLGRPFDALTDGATSIVDLSAEGHGPPVEVRFGLPGGGVAWGLVSATLLSDAEGRPTQRVVMVQDVTRHKEAERELARAIRLESLALMAGGIAHDFNNLLTPVIGNVSMAVRRTEGDVRTMLVLAEQAAGRIRELAQQLLVFARGGVTSMKPGLLTEVVTECVELCLRGTSVRCELSLEPEPWAADFDAGQMVQVFTNLLLNGVQAMPEGGVVECAVRNVQTGGKRYVQATVRDHGCGIAPEDLGRVFDPFFTTKSQGRGLGLATTHTIVAAHGGRIDVASEVGRGSVFTVTLPALDGVPAATDSRPEEASTPAGVARLLVMDDERLVRETTRSMLASCGYDVDAVADGDEALAAYEEARRQGRPYAAVILDLTVPGGRGGADTMARLLELDANARGIVASGYSSGAVIDDPRRSGFRGAVNKPFTLRQLHDAVSSVLSEPAA